MRPDKMFHINTKDLCLICFKDCDPQYKTEGKLLCKILSLYFGADFRVPELELELQRREMSFAPSTPLPINFPICENCSMLADKIIQLFQQLEVAHMRLHHYGQNLRDIMRSAEKVSARVSLFLQRLDSVKEEPQGKTRQILTIVGQVRREIMSKCTSTRRRKNINPTKHTLPTIQVDLNKQNIPEKEYLPLTATPCHCHFLLPANFPETEEDWLAFLGCTISLWIVFLLSLLDVDQLVEMTLFRQRCQLKALETSPPPHHTTTSPIQDTVVVHSKSVHSQTHSDEIMLTEKVKNSRKRRTSDDNNGIFALKKFQLEDQSSLLISAIPVDNSREGTAEHDIIQEKHNPLLEISKKILQSNTNWKTDLPTAHRKFTGEEMQLYSLITKEEAMNAVHAIQYRPRLQSCSKIEMVKREEGNQEDASLDFFPASDLLCSSYVHSSEMKIKNQSDTETPEEYLNCLNDSIEVLDVLPNNAINFIDLPKRQESFISTPHFNVTGEPSPNADYTCHLCNQNFLSRGMLEKHRVLIHKLQRYVKCPTCSEMQLDYYHLELHRKIVPECEIDEDVKEAEMADMARPLFPFDSCIRGTNFCPVEDCCEVFENGRKLSTHLKLHGSFQCRFGCLQVFKKGHELALHEMKKHDYRSPPLSNLLKCPRCEYTTNKKDVNEYMIHFIRSHLNIFAYVAECRICNKSFCSLNGSRAHFLNYHNVAGRGEKYILKCDHCEGQFRKKSQLLQHKQTMHLQLNKVF